VSWETVKGSRSKIAGLLLLILVLMAPTFIPGAVENLPRPYQSSGDIFTDITSAAGISWKHFNGESEDRFLIETSSGGAGFLDYDGDGLLDLFLVNGGQTPKGKSELPVRHALYRNLGNGKFQEVAAKAGVDTSSFYGMGVAAADYDNDGFQDLFLTGYPSCALFHNNRDGTFTDVTVKAAVQNQGKWAASAAWFDYDRDGMLDLFICNYAELSFSDFRRCEIAGQRSYCNPTAYEGQAPTLYHNQGDGTFLDTTSRSGVAKHVGRGFGVVSVDANDDGWVDLFVARDTSPNLLLVNQKNGTFKDSALDAETAYNSDGKARAGMGVDAGDYNGDGRPDFVVTNFNDEYHALYINSQTFPFADWTRESGLAGFTKTLVGWGVHFIDYNNDGNLDLILVNGHPNKTIELTRQDVTYQEPPLLLSNNGKGVFQNVSQNAGPTFHNQFSARGMAVGDFDNDGDLDVAFVCLNGSPVILRNNVGQDATWIGFQLEGTKDNRDAIGSRLTVTLGQRKLARWITGGASFLASHDKRILFGLGSRDPSDPVNVDVLWPSGLTEAVSGLRPNQYHKIVEAKTSTN
jgi:hypothetical protein